MLTNFGVFSGEQTFDLTPEQSLDQTKPIIIFGGKNGTGKTTFLEAFKVCLYGSFFRGRKIPNGDYNKYIRSHLHRNSEGKKATFASISLEFDCAKLGYIDSYFVKRSWTTNGQGLVETLCVQENGKPLAQVNEEQWQNFLMELIPPGLSRLFFFDGEKIQSLARGQAVNRHIVESINSLLGIDLIERLKYDLKVYCATQHPEGKDFQKRIIEIDSNIELLQKKLDSAYQNRASLQNTLVQIEQDIALQELKISSEGGGFASQREQLEKQGKELEAKIELKKDDIRGLCAELLPFAYVPDLCQSLRERLHDEETEQQRQAVLTYFNDATVDFTREFEQGAFLNALNLSHKDKQLVAKEALAVLRKKIEKMNTTSKEPIHAVSVSERQELLAWIDKALSKVPSKLGSLSVELRTLKTEYETNQQYLFSAPADEVLKPLFLKLGVLREDLGKTKQQQLHIEQEIKTIEYDLVLVHREKAKLLSEQVVYDRSIKRLELATRTQKVIEEYLQRLRNVKVTEFRDNFLECFNLLFSKNDLISAVEIDENTFDLTLLTHQGVAISKSEFSAGERQIYAMAMIWALVKTSGRTLPFIIDTPLGRLDSDHRNSILSNFFIDASHQMIIFSTNTEIDQHYFDQLQPYISKAYNLEYNSEQGQTIAKSGYFWTNKVSEC